MSVFSKGRKIASVRLMTAGLAVFTAINFTMPAAASGSLYVERYQVQRKTEIKDYRVSFPHISGIGDVKAQQSLNVLFEEKAKAALAAAEYRVRTAAANNEKVSGAFEYSVTRNRDGILSLLFISTLCGSETHSAVTLNTVSGRRLLLCDLFIDNADYTGTISDFIRAEKGSRAKRKSLISENAEYYLTGNSLVVIMPQADEGGKQQEIAVPLSSLEGILKPCLHLT